MRGTRLKWGAAASAAAVALLVAGCGSGDGGAGGGEGEDGGSASAAGGSGGDGGKSDARPDDGGPGGGADTGGSGGSGSSGGSGGGGGDKADLSPYLGPWAAGMKSDGGKPMILIFNKDGTVSLAAQDLACQGTVEAAGQPAKLAMECRDGEDRFTRGTITEVNGESLTVKWASGEPTEFLKGAAPAGPTE